MTSPEELQKEPSVRKCSECGLKDKCPVWTGFCRKHETENKGTCEDCGRKNVTLVRHGNYNGALVCQECAVARMY
jgi:hypothetical protein